jgi:hypothetical protein
MEQYTPHSIASPEQSLFELQVDHEVSGHLSQTAKWAKFLAIMGFISCGFLLLMALFVGKMQNLSPMRYEVVGTDSFWPVVLLIAMAVLYFFPCLFTLNFSNKMLLAIRTNDQNSLVASFRNLKLAFKYIGIITIVIISIYLLAFLIVLVFAATR